MLDASGVQTAYVYGESGAAPHILSFLSRHPDRARAATILMGAAPLVDAEAEQMIELNRVEWFLMKDGDRARIEANLRPWWQEELRDPVAAMLQVLDGGPESDRRVLQDATFLSNVERSTREALSTEENFQAWIDESFALRFGWDDIELDRISTSITWYHGHGDTTAPFTAARRLVDRLPTARLVEIEDGGHLALFDQVRPGARRAAVARSGLTQVTTGVARRPSTIGEVDAPGGMRRCKWPPEDPTTGSAAARPQVPTSPGRHASHQGCRPDVPIWCTPPSQQRTR